MSEPNWSGSRVEKACRRDLKVFGCIEPESRWRIIYVPQV